MSDSSQNVGAEWAKFVQNMNKAMAEAAEQNMEASAEFMEAWSEGFVDSMPENDDWADGMEGYNNAVEVWMDATEEMSQRLSDAVEGETVEVEEFRDIWLQSANQAFKEVMGTSTFAAANGQFVEAMMDLQKQTDQLAEETLADIGMPTGSDIDEVGRRLVELERRQHRVERKLDRVIDALEDE